MPVSPNPSSADSLEDEVSVLRARNKILTDALKEVQESASKAVKKNFDLVWYARNRCKFLFWFLIQCSIGRINSHSLIDRDGWILCDTVARYPNHDASKRIQKSEEHREDLDLLKSDDADYHHGFHAGVLAAARMFKEHAEVIDVASNDVRFLRPNSFNSCLYKTFANESLSGLSRNLR